MPERTYESVLGGNGNLNAVPFNNHYPRATLWGVNFLAACTNANLTPAGHMAQICTNFHNALRVRNWTWAPAGAGNSYTAGARLLDNTVNAGECAYVPNALAYLVNAPAPWGFGTGGATVEVYNGQDDKGFIALHANNLPGPQPNIIQPNGQTLPGYYLWGNHKVVCHNGTRYDACYNVQHATLAGMDRASLWLVRERVRLRDLRDYNYTGLWSGAHLAGRVLSDWVWWNKHTVDVYQAVGTDANVTGFYLQWSQHWWTLRSGRNQSAAWYGPYPTNPLVR